MRSNVLSRVRYYFGEKHYYLAGRLRTLKYLFQGVVYGKNTTINKCKIGRFCRLGYDNMISGSTIGDYTYTASNTKIYNSDIGKYCSISWNVTIGPHEHLTERWSTHGFSYLSRYNIVKKNISLGTVERTSIGHDVWIGCNVVIIRGVKIGNGAVIGAGSVITRDVPKYAIVVGNPATVLKYRFSNPTIMEIEESKWWEWPEEKIRENIELFQGSVNIIQKLCE